MPSPRRATIADVAAASGVGVGTVSRVINGAPNVREGTRTSVLKVIEQLGYRPSHLAASLSRGTARTMAIVVPHLTRPSVVMRLAGALAVLDEQGYDTVVCNVDTPQQRDHHLAALTKRHRADGVMVVSLRLSRQQLESFQRAGVPLVTVGVLAPGVPQTITDDVMGGRLATGHLLALGHRRIGFVGGLVDSACEQARLHGYLASLTRAGIEPDPALVSHRDFHYETGYGDGARLLDLAAPPTAVFAASDAIALGVLETAREHGLTVPGDLSVVGFDDTYVAEWTTPPLTTVRQPLQEMGGLAFRTLMRLRAGDPPESHHVEMATQLILRGSTAPPRAVRPTV